MSIKAIKAFDAAWSAARDGGEQGYKVSYGEFKTAVAELKKDGGRISKDELQHVAQTIAESPYLTKPAAKEAFELLKTLGTSKLDSATVDLMKAEFSLRNRDPFKSVELPGRQVKNTVDLPDAVAKSVNTTHDADSDEDWGEVECRSATLAGQPVYLVLHRELGGNLDVQRLEIFARDGRTLATGGIWDGMAGFMWD